MQIFRFPDAGVRGKHSAWQSAHSRAEARTHYTQRNGTQKPSSGRKGYRDSGGRSPRDFQLAWILLSRALPQSFAAQNPAPSRREPFISYCQQKNTTKENSLMVFVFSPLKLQRRKTVPFKFFVYKNIKVCYNSSVICGEVSEWLICGRGTV